MPNPLVATLTSLRGNPRACVYTEPLWGLSLNLCLPYASVYMLALGLGDSQIGLVASIGMLAQVGAGLLGGVITDKLGRRRSTAIFDTLAWSTPCVIWFAASFVDPKVVFWVFIGASIFNSAQLISQNAWDCLMVEDAEREQIPRIYSLMMVAGNLSALFAPISAALVVHYSLVTAMRILYINAAVVMLAKIIWLYLWSHETETGLVRMSQTKGVGIWQLVSEYRGVLGIIRRSPGTIFALVIAALFGAVNSVNSTFWQVVVNRKLLVPAGLLPYFPMARSLLAILFFFTVIHKVTGSSHFKVPLLCGFGAYLVGQVVISTLPAEAGGAGLTTYLMLGVSVVFDSFGVSMLAMLAEALMALAVDKQERSRVMAVQRTVVMLSIAPFGWVAGLLSDVDRSLPFIMTSALLVIGLAATQWRFRRASSNSLITG